MKLSVVVASLLGSTLARKCPVGTTIQSDEVKSNFSMEAFMGTYYEIAYHVYSQPIGVCGCQRSVKTFHDDRIWDDFTLNCGSKTDNTQTHTYHNNLSFGLTEDPGVWVGKWPIVSSVDFPDTLVDVGPINEDGQYSWVLEFQCVEEFSEIVFIGVNFYSSLKTPDFLDDMKASATKLGLDEFIYPAKGNQLTLVDQTGCLYNNTKIIGDEADSFDYEGFAAANFKNEQIVNMAVDLEFIQ